MKRSAKSKALVLARIKDNAREKPHTWASHKRGPWDRKKADGGSVEPLYPPDVQARRLTDEEVRERQEEMNRTAPAIITMENRGARKAEGGEVDKPAFDPSAPFEAAAGDKPAFDPSKPFESTKDNGKRGAAWSDAVTDIPSEIGRAASENWGAIKKAFVPDGQGGQGQLERLANTGKGLLGIPGLALSPVTGAARSLIGHPMAQLTHKAGEIIAPEIAAKDDPEKMYETAKGDVDLALSAARPRGAPIKSAGAYEWDAPKPAPTPAGPAEPANDVVSAAERASQVAPSPIEVPRAFASDNIAVQRAGQLARNVPFVGDSIPKATGRMAEQMGDTVKSVASHYGEGSGPNVSNRIGRRVSEAAEQEAAAATNAARASDDALLADWQRSQDSAFAGVAQHETNALEAARRATGDMSPQDMGEALIHRLRAGEQEARQLKDRLYAGAGESDGAISAAAVPAVRPRIAQSLADAGREIDATLTPASSRMMTEVDRFSRSGNADVTHGAIYPRSMQEIEQTRKRLNSFSQAATNDADRAASRMIVREFDNWVSHSFDNALFSGSDAALNAFREARAANASWRQRFFNDRDDADRLINKVVTGEVTPQEMSNWIVGSSQVGSKGMSSRMLTRLAEVTGNDPAAMDAIRGGVANRLFGATEGVTAKNPAKITDGIAEFFNGSGRDVARRLYTPAQRQAALDYATTLRRAAEAREIIGEAAKNSKPSAMPVGPGPMQELATSILGKSGKTDEALFSAIDAYARSGARGDVRTLSDIVRSVPEKDKGDLAGAIIRNLGQSKTTGEFSPELFASEWQKYTPQAKTVLFGNAGPHRQALDDIALISQRYKDVGRRFGNPSGTAQNVAGLGALTSIFTAPLVAIPSLVGGAIFAKMLSMPVTAQKTATLLKTAQAASKGLTSQKLIAFTSAANSFAKSAERLGANLSAPDFMRQIQGAIPSRADDKKQ